METANDGEHAIVFEGDPGPFIGLVAKNLLLTIITLGIYRFWAKAAVRRYLWSRTRVLGDTLEWRGTGMQLFLGALLAFALVGLPFVLLSFAFQAMLAAKNFLAAGLLYLALIVGLLYIVNVGLYRSWRYLLAWTSWRGIRGGMATGGWAYGWLALRMTLLQSITFGLATPYASVRLWNARWNDATFGSAPFRAEVEWKPLFKRFWPLLVVTIVGVLLVEGGLLAVVGLSGLRPQPGAPPHAVMRTIGLLYLVFAVLGLGLSLLWSGYIAAFWRAAIGGTSLGGMRFGFEANAMTWFRYQLTNIAIILGTLGLGALVMPYRHFAFFAARMSASGTLDTAAMAQTSVDAPRQGDGIADAFNLTGV